MRLAGGPMSRVKSCTVLAGFDPGHSWVRASRNSVLVVGGKFRSWKDSEPGAGFEVSGREAEPCCDTHIASRSRTVGEQPPPAHWVSQQRRIGGGGREGKRWTGARGFAAPTKGLIAFLFSHLFGAPQGKRNIVCPGHPTPDGTTLLVISRNVAYRRKG